MSNPNQKIITMPRVWIGASRTGPERSYGVLQFNPKRCEAQLITTWGHKFVAPFSAIRTEPTPDPSKGGEL
jgi:hypothetical protein